MTTTHFTAWLTTTTDALDSDDCDITVLADTAITYLLDEDGNESEPVWESTGDPVFHALTDLPTDADPAAVERRAVALLTAAGWTTVGRWEAVDTGATITATRKETDR